MRFDLFQYRLPHEGTLDDLNAFLAGRRVTAVTHHMQPGAGGALLVFVVESIGGSAPAPAPAPDRRVDYKELLCPGDFAVFSRLRELRKQCAEQEGVPVFALFSNAQLAAMAEQRPGDMAALRRIAGARAADRGADEPVSRQFFSRWPRPGLDATGGRGPLLALYG